MVKHLREMLRFGQTFEGGRCPDLVKHLRGRGAGFGQTLEGGGVPRFGQTFEGGGVPRFGQT